MLGCRVSGERDVQGMRPVCGRRKLHKEFWWGKPVGKRPYGRSRHGWADKIENVYSIERWELDQIHLAHKRGKGRATVITIMNLPGFHKIAAAGSTDRQPLHAAGCFHARLSLYLLKTLPIPTAATTDPTQRRHLVFEFWSGAIANFRILGDILFRSLLIISPHPDKIPCKTSRKPTPSYFRSFLIMQAIPPYVRINQSKVSNPKTQAAVDDFFHPDKIP